ncbi:MAG: hypothetical protein M1822_005684 [Bathelium mastoideum]|nr:MAG: hypothetical protein M1822_005684 [Bathelium mastoideum]
MSIPSSHKAAIVPEAKAKHTITTRTTPSPEPDEVLIKILATAINPIDWKVRDFNITPFLGKPPYPAVLGSDASGEVVATGGDVKNFQVGERVFFQGIIGSYDSCTFQQYCKLPASLVGKTPGNISDDAAAGVSLAVMAVVTGFYDKTGQGLSPPPWKSGGETVGKGKAAIILGGSSSVGQYAIQFARLSGFERIITNSSPQHKEHLKSLGATDVLERSESTAQAFKDAAGNLEVSFVLDAISTEDTQTLGIEILRLFNGGKVVTVLPPEEKVKNLGEEKGQKRVAVEEVVAIGSLPALRHVSEPVMKALGGEDGWIARGKFFVNRPQLVPGGLGGIEDALEKSKKGVSGVKLIVQPHGG